MKAATHTGTEANRYRPKVVFSPSKVFFNCLRVSEANMERCGGHELSYCGRLYGLT